MFFMIILISGINAFQRLTQRINGFKNRISNPIIPHTISRNSPTKLNLALEGTDVLSMFFKNYPYISSFLVTGIKGCFADTVAQYKESIDAGIKKKFDWLRNLAFILYAGGYQGCAQYFIYNTLFPSWFGVGTDFLTIARKVSFDLLILTPLVCLPVAYLTKAAIYTGIRPNSLLKGLERYIYDVKNNGLIFKYWALWGPVQSLTFSIIPVHLRIAFIAGVSFFWLIILSSISATPKTTEEEKKIATAVVGGEPTIEN